MDLPTNNEHIGDILLEQEHQWSEGPSFVNEYEYYCSRPGFKQPRRNDATVMWSTYDGWTTDYKVDEWLKARRTLWSTTVTQWTTSRVLFTRVLMVNSDTIYSNMRPCMLWRSYIITDHDIMMKHYYLAYKWKRNVLTSYHWTYHTM